MRWRSSTLFSPSNGTIESSVGTRALGLSREWLGHPRPLERMAGAPSPSRENGWGALALSREWLGHPRPLEKMSTRECQQGEKADRGNPNTRRAPVLGAPLAGEGGSAVGWLPPFSTHPPPHTPPPCVCVYLAYFLLGWASPVSEGGAEACTATGKLFHPGQDSAYGLARIGPPPSCQYKQTTRAARATRRKTAPSQVGSPGGGRRDRYAPRKKRLHSP
jgi:hypothetical protein